MSDLYCELMGQPTLSIANGTKAASGDNELIAAPTSPKRLAVFYIKVQNESATATTAVIKHGATSVERVLLQTQGDALVREYDPPRLLPIATALNLNLSGANSHGYTVEYIEI
jgi:hypothetical protein